MSTERIRPKAPAWASSFLIFVLVLLYAPIFYLVAGSFLDEAGQLTLKWYMEFFNDEILVTALQRSFSISITSSLISTMIGTLTALALFKIKNRVSLFLQGFSTLSLVMPELVFALALLSWFFILGFELGFTTVVMAHVTFSLSFVVMTVSSRLNSMDLSFEEAARDLGAGDWTVIFKIILPLLKPAMAMGFLLSFLLSFDDFLITYFVNDVGLDTLPIKLYSSMKLGHSPKLNAMSAILIFITVALTSLILKVKSFRDLFIKN